MRGFKRLQTLCIQPEVILGGCCKADYAPFQLRDTLPPNLRSLTLFGEEGLCRNKTLGRQIQDVLEGTDFTMLGHIALEAITDYVVGNFTDPADPPHDQVRRACQGTGRRYETRTRPSAPGEA
jgi:hypothetical protein